jgi:hypothetical protein
MTGSAVKYKPFIYLYVTANSVIVFESSYLRIPAKAPYILATGAVGS